MSDPFLNQVILEEHKVLLQEVKWLRDLFKRLGMRSGGAEGAATKLAREQPGVMQALLRLLGREQKLLPEKTKLSANSPFKEAYKEFFRDIKEYSMVRNVPDRMPDAGSSRLQGPTGRKGPHQAWAAAETKFKKTLLDEAHTWIKINGIPESGEDLIKLENYIRYGERGSTVSADSSTRSIFSDKSLMHQSYELDERFNKLTGWIGAPYNLRLPNFLSAIENSYKVDMVLPAAKYSEAIASKAVKEYRALDTAYTAARQEYEFELISKLAENKKLGPAVNARLGQSLEGEGHFQGALHGLSDDIIGSIETRKIMADPRGGTQWGSYGGRGKFDPKRPLLAQIDDVAELDRLGVRTSLSNKELYAYKALWELTNIPKNLGNLKKGVSSDVVRLLDSQQFRSGWDWTDSSEALRNVLKDVDKFTDFVYPGIDRQLAKVAGIPRKELRNYEEALVKTISNSGAIETLKAERIDNAQAIADSVAMNLHKVKRPKGIADADWDHSTLERMSKYLEGPGERSLARHPEQHWQPTNRQIRGDQPLWFELERLVTGTGRHPSRDARNQIKEFLKDIDKNQKAGPDVQRALGGRLSLVGDAPGQGQLSIAPEVADKGALSIADKKYGPNTEISEMGVFADVPTIANKWPKDKKVTLRDFEEANPSLWLNQPSQAWVWEPTTDKLRKALDLDVKGPESAKLPKQLELPWVKDLMSTKKPPEERPYGLSLGQSKQLEAPKVDLTMPSPSDPNIIPQIPDDIIDMLDFLKK